MPLGLIIVGLNTSFLLCACVPGTLGTFPVPAVPYRMVIVLGVLNYETMPSLAGR